MNFRHITNHNLLNIPLLNTMPLLNIVQYLPVLIAVDLGKLFATLQIVLQAVQTAHGAVVRV